MRKLERIYKTMKEDKNEITFGELSSRMFHENDCVNPFWSVIDKKSGKELLTIDLDGDIHPTKECESEEDAQKEYERIEKMRAVGMRRRGNGFYVVTVS